ncbi:MAG: hypothetical protein EOM64_02730 [Erysipelotrichia bacterium]|nr:hypothetical protein [Erysipelotrichia bacterium]
MNAEKGLYNPICTLSSECRGDELYRKLLQMPEIIKQSNHSVWLSGSILEQDPKTHQLFSSHAIRESLISGEWLKESGYLITDNEDVLKQAALQHVPDVNYMVFSFQEWVRNNALFYAFKKNQNNEPWYEWPEELRLQPKLQSVILKPYQNDLLYSAFAQQMLFLQWNRIRQNAADQDVRIVGSLPYLSAYDSADVWSHQECFHEDGSYHWDAMRSDRFSWWMDRIGYTSRLYDGVILESFEQLVKQGGETFFEELKNTSDELLLYADDREVLSDSAEDIMNRYGISLMHADKN